MLTVPILVRLLPKAAGSMATRVFAVMYWKVFDH